MMAYVRNPPGIYVYLPDPPSPPIRTLICKGGLGYCCPWAFFELLWDRDTATMADRLGCGVRVIQVWRARWRDKEIECEGAANCMRGRVKR